MDRMRAGIIAVLSAVAISGCGEYPLKESQIEESLPTTTASITVGATDRADVRRLLGTPLVASDHWQFDLFHLTDKNLDLIWIFVPMGFSSQDVSGYVLVTYDERGVVAGCAHGFARESSIYRSDPGEGANLVAGDVQLTTGEDLAFVAVSADRRDSYLSEYKVPERCRVVMGCVPPWCPVRLEIDGDRQSDLTPALADQLSALVVRDLAAGEHGIEVTPALSRAKFAGATQFSCAAGQTLFIAVDITPDDTKGETAWRRHLITNLTVSGQMPEALTELPLLIWRNGQWLVPQEPEKNEQAR